MTLCDADDLSPRDRDQLKAMQSLIDQLQADNKWLRGILAAVEVLGQQYRRGHPNG